MLQEVTLTSVICETCTVITCRARMESRFCQTPELVLLACAPHVHGATPGPPIPANVLTVVFNDQGFRKGLSCWK